MDKALQTQLANIEKRTGQTLDELVKLIKASGLTKHGAVRDMLKAKLGIGHGDANTLVHFAFKSAAVFEAPKGSSGDPANEFYAGPRADLRAIHDRVMAAIEKFGPFEVAPKKTYLSLRRKKQFAMVGPATNTRVEVGLNMKGVPGTDRLLEQPPGRMCQYIVKLTDAQEVDKELIGWIRQAYDQSA